MRDISPPAQYDEGLLSMRDISPSAQYDEGNPYCIFRFSTGRNLKRAVEESCEALTPSLR